MMDIAYEWIGWILIATGAVGCFLPVVPGPPIAYAALLLALARGDHSSPGVSVLVVAGAVMVAVLALDWIVPSLGAKKFNCSRIGMLGCFVGTIAGMFFLPYGVVAGPFLGAFAGLRFHRLSVLVGGSRLVAGGHASPDLKVHGDELGRDNCNCIVLEAARNDIISA